MSSIQKIIIGLILVFGFVLLFSLEIGHLQNYLELRSFIIISLIIGALIGLVLGWFLGKKRSEPIEKFQIGVASVILGILIIPLLISLTNRLLDFRTVQQEKVEIVSIQAYSGSRFGTPKEIGLQTDGHRAFVIRNGEVKRLQKKENPFPDKQKGDIVLIPVKKGLWGFEFVDWKAVL